MSTSALSQATIDARKPILERLQYDAIGDDLAVLSRSIPKRPRVLFFGRPSFSDNTKYLYLEALAQPRDYEVIWCTLTDTVEAQLAAHGLPVLNLKRNINAGVQCLLEASVAVFCENMNSAFGGNNMFPGALAGAQIIQLWHGVSVKHLDLMLVPHLNPYDPGFRNAVKLATRSNYLLSTSPILDAFWTQSFGADRLVRAGQPRNAVIGRQPTAHEFIGAELPDEQLQIMNDPERRKLLLVPTWQRGKPLFISTRACDQRLAAWAERHNATIFVKSHPFRFGEPQPANVPGRLYHLDPGVDVYPWMGRMDALITDYSSIMFDFLFTGKPIFTFDARTEVSWGFEPDWSLIPDTPFRYPFTADTLEQVLDANLDRHPLAASQAVLRSQLFATDAERASADLMHLVDACNVAALEKPYDVLEPALQTT